MNLNTFCRTCLHTEEIMLPLFPINLIAADNGPITVVDLLKLFTKILIFKNDGFPQQICINCLEEIKRLYEFKVKCERSETILVKSLANILLPSKVDNQNVNVIASGEISDDLLLDSLFDVDEFIKYEEINDDSALSTATELQSSTDCMEEVDTVVDSKPFTTKEVDAVNFTVNPTKIESYTDRTFQLTVKEINTAIAPKQKIKLGVAINTAAKLIKEKVDTSKTLKSTVKEVYTIKNFEPILKEINTINKLLLNKKKKAPVKRAKKKVNTAATATSSLMKKVPIKIAPKLPLSTNLTVTQLKPADKIENVGGIPSLQPLVIAPNISQQPVNNTQILSGVPIIPLSSLLQVVNFFQTNSIDNNLQQQNPMIYKVCLKDEPKITTCSVTDIKKAATIVRSDHDYPRLDSQNSVSTEPSLEIPSALKELDRGVGNNDEEIFKCPACADEFKKPDVLRQHIINNHTRDEKCMICNRDNITRMRDHCSKHLPQKYFCKDCDKGFIQRDLLAKHLKRYYRKDKFECSSCSKIFCLYSDLKLHMSKYAKPKLLKSCEYCDQKFEKVLQLRKHKLKEHVKSDYKCDICFKVFSIRINFIANKYNHNRHRPYKCDVCPKSCPSRNYLKSHMATHHRLKHIQCPTCSKKFVNGKNTRTHVTDIHQNKRRNNPVRCNICLKVLCSKISLLAHKQTHDGARPLRCDICRLLFVTKAALQNHLKTFHSLTHVYKCKNCATSFRSAPRIYKLKKHRTGFEREMKETQFNSEN